MRFLAHLILVIILSFSALAEVDCGDFYLEEDANKKTIEFLANHNKQTLETLGSNPLFNELKSKAYEVLTSDDRLIYGSIRGDYFYNFWKDKENPRGLLRRTKFSAYKRGNPKWETVLNIDELAKTDGKAWAYKGMTRHAGTNKAMVMLSDGGKDAGDYFEFDLTTNTFVEDGFHIPENLTYITWYDQDSLLVGTKFNADSVSKSGYPLEIRLLKRGQTLEESEFVFKADADNMAAWVSRQKVSGEKKFFISVSKNFYESEYYIADTSLKFEKFEVPTFFSLNGYLTKESMLGSVTKDWVFDNQTIKAGSILEIDLNKYNSQTGAGIIKIAEPNERIAIQSVTSMKGRLIVKVSEDVSSAIYEYKKVGSNWFSRKLDFPANGNISLLQTHKGKAFFGYENFVTPPSIYYYSNRKSQPSAFESLQQKFDPSKYEVKQHFVDSKDGLVKVPYYMIAPKGMKLDGKNPTLIYGYGGFEISLEPRYLEKVEKLWLEKGGVYIIANIRGGGEYGPRWHQAALKENRQKAYDDFYAVAEDVHAKNISSPRHTGVQGGSNGGLLTGVALTQRPELYNAVISQVPLLDMLRFHKLSRGSSWIGEYGNPDIAEQAAYISKYSPYQNIQKAQDTKYPRSFFLTSNDDRVHPGHARRMVKKLQDNGQEVLMFSGSEGGHGGSSTPEQRAIWDALEFTYLWEQLGRTE